jgi:signal transduction histidine kinase
VSAPRSLRSRLIVLYTTCSFIVLATLGLLVVAGVFGSVTRPLARDLARAVAAAEAIVATAPSTDSVDEIQRRIAERENSSRLVAIAIPAGALRRGPPGLQSSEIDMGAPFGLSPAFLPVRDESVVIIPDREAVEALFRWLYAFVALTLALALWAAWLIARIGARETLRPLLTVTAELERFASGDFTPRPQAISDQSEFGALASAYNEAANRVTQAFLERRRVEEQIRQFVAEAGHELRTPLTVVAGYVDVLRRGGLDDAAIRGAAFASLTTEVKRMRTLVERLMTLARLDRLLEAQPEVVDVGAIVRQAVEAFAVIAETPISLEAPDELLVLGEPVDLYEAVANLIENALKYGERSAVAVVVAGSSSSISVRVRDGGPGISENDRARIFERFYRGDRGDIAGSGLGLAIAVKAAERLGGRIVLEDARAGSTTFALIVPALAGIGPAAQRVAGHA